MITQWYKEKENVEKKIRRGNERMEMTVERERFWEVRGKGHDCSHPTPNSVFTLLLDNIGLSEGFSHRSPSVQRVLISGSYFQAKILLTKSFLRKVLILVSSASST